MCTFATKFVKLVVQTKKSIIMMKQILLSLFFCLTLGHLVVVAQPSQQDVQELVDSSSTANGVDAFSDTTAVDTAQQSQVVYHQGADFDDDEFMFDTFKGGTALMILLTIVLAVLPFLLLGLPLLLIILLVILLARKRKPRRHPDAELNQGNTTNSIDNMPTEKKLYRSDDRIIGGVCAGLAEYLGIDTAVVRICYVLLTFFTAFSGVLIYIILLLLMPQRP